MSIEIGSLVRLKKEWIAADEWHLRGYEKLIGVVIDNASSDGECRILWQGKGKYHQSLSGTKQYQWSWEYTEGLELVQ
tara:strand:+ start:1139 stop:1372 length:234 start_codon:yes stop_codon:yes gene_type:complete